MCGDLFFAFTMVKPHRTITKALMYNYIFSTGLQGNYKLVSFNIHSITNQSNITKIFFRLNILPYSFLSQIIIVINLIKIITSQLKDRFPGIFQGDYFSQIV